MLLLFRIQDFLDRKLLISDTADILHQCLIGLNIFFLRVLGSNDPVEIDVLHAHWILSSLCFTIGITLVSPVKFHFSSIIGSCTLFIVGL